MGRSSIILVFQIFLAQCWPELTKNDIFFVTRSKNNAIVTPLKKRRGRESAGAIEDRKILLETSMKKYRRIVYKSPDDGHIYYFT
jgi:putative transposase